MQHSLLRQTPTKDVFSTVQCLVRELGRDCLWHETFCSNEAMAVAGCPSWCHQWGKNQTHIAQLRVYRHLTWTHNASHYIILVATAATNTTAIVTYVKYLFSRWFIHKQLIYCPQAMHTKCHQNQKLLDDDSSPSQQINLCSQQS